MKKEFVMRGQVTSSKSTGEYEILNFSGKTTGYAYRLIEFRVWPSGGTNTNDELDGIITAGKTVADPAAPNFNDAGIIGVACWENSSSEQYGPNNASLVDDTFLITQDLLLSANDYQGDSPINWFCRFKAEKVNDAEQAVANFNQFTIFDG